MVSRYIFGIKVYKEREDTYYLYRVFNLEDDEPSMRIYPGDLEKHFKLQSHT